MKLPRIAILLLTTASLIAVLAAPVNAQQWHSETGFSSNQIQVWSYTSYNDFGWGAPTVQSPCSSPHSPNNWCTYLKGGWVRYPITISGPDGKGYDHVSVSANTGAWWDGCGISLTKASSSPRSNVVAISEMTCAPQASWPNHNMWAGVDDPFHTAGQHYVWIYCNQWESQSCNLYIYDQIQVTAYYRQLTIDIRDLQQETFGLSNLAPETCANFWMEGSPHHRNVEISIDWGLGASAVQTQQIDIGSDGAWQERRCQTLPLSVLDYQLCFRVRELDGLERQLTECRTVNGGIL